jgi:hypothetical protein
MNPNMRRLTVTLGMHWRRYCKVAPPGWELIGVVQRGQGLHVDIGALGVDREGNYALIRGPRISILTRRKVLAALDAVAAAIAQT